MRPLELLVVYLLIGFGVSFAWNRAGKEGWGWAVPLWPLFLPGLLVAAPSPEPAPPGPWQARIDGAVAGLARALSSWDALPERAVCEASLAAAARGLAALSDRHEQLDLALRGPEHDIAKLRIELESAPLSAQPVMAARLRNVERLAALRDEARAELERALAGLADLSTRVQLARFTGSSAEALSAQIARLAAAVDGAAEVSRLGRTEAI